LQVQGSPEIKNITHITKKTQSSNHSMKQRSTRSRLAVGDTRKRRQRACGMVADLLMAEMADRNAKVIWERRAILSIWRLIDGSLQQKPKRF
jgi:hypothetical protein